MEKKAFTVLINKDTYERVRSIAYYTPGMTISRFVQDAIDTHQKGFDKHPRIVTDLKRGRRPSEE